MTCPACRAGDLHEELVETWVQRGSRWVLLRNLPALVCDNCGDRSFEHDSADWIARVADASELALGPTDFLTAFVYDVKLIREAEAAGRRSFATVATAPRGIQLFPQGAYWTGETAVELAFDVGIATPSYKPAWTGTSEDSVSFRD